MAYFRPTQQLKEHRMELNWKQSEQSGDFPYLVDLHGIEIVTSFLSGILAAPSSFTQQTCFYHGGYMLYSCSSSCTRKLCFWTKSAISSKFRGGQIKEWHDPGKIPSKKNKSIECHLYKFNDPMPLLRRRASTFHFFKPSSYHSIYKWAQVKANTLFTDGMNIEKTCISGLNWKYRTQVYQSPVLPRQRHEYLALVVEFSKEKTADSAWPSVNERLTSVIAQIVVLNSTCMQRARFEEMNIYNDRWYLGK